EAAQTGWSERRNSTGELIIAFHPALLPSYLEAVEMNTHIPAERIAVVVNASGLNEPFPAAPEERARRATTQLVRNAAFSRNVVIAYDGLCALCGLNLSLVQGAHIYPAHAPHSPDATWNGIALCANHHVAFDRHLLWIDPEDRRVVFHPAVYAQNASTAASRHFVASTFAVLREPANAHNRPRKEMFEQRYEFFAEDYAWAG